MRNEVRAPWLGNVLQKSLWSKTCNRVYHCWLSLPPEYPAGHRKADCRITQMHHSHKSPPSGPFMSPSGEAPLNLYRHNSNECEDEQGPSVPSTWPRS